MVLRTDAAAAAAAQLVCHSHLIVAPQVLKLRAGRHHRTRLARAEFRDGAVEQRDLIEEINS